MRLHRVFRNYPRMEYLSGIIAVGLWSIYHYLVWTEEKFLEVLNVN